MAAVSPARWVAPSGTRPPPIATGRSPGPPRPWSRFLLSRLRHASRPVRSDPMTRANERLCLSHSAHGTSTSRVPGALKPRNAVDRAPADGQARRRISSSPSPGRTISSPVTVCQKVTTKWLGHTFTHTSCGRRCVLITDWFGCFEGTPRVADLPKRPSLVDKGSARELENSSLESLSPSQWVVRRRGQKAATARLRSRTGEHIARVSRCRTNGGGGHF